MKIPKSHPVIGVVSVIVLVATVLFVAIDWRQQAVARGAAKSDTEAQIASFMATAVPTSLDQAPNRGCRVWAKGRPANVRNWQDSRTDRLQDGSWRVFGAKPAPAVWNDLGYWQVGWYRFYRNGRVGSGAPGRDDRLLCPPTAPAR